MKSVRFITLAIIIVIGNLCSVAPSFAILKGSAPTNQYANACPQLSQNWCVGSDGFTVFTPTVPATPTGSCGSTGTFNGTCVVYIAENGTGTPTTCSIPATGTFSFTTDIGDTNACNYTEAHMALARNNSSDFPLFKRGDCFVDPNVISPCTGIAPTYQTSYGICTAHGITCNWARNGTSAAAPMVIGAYGAYSKPRPRILSANTGFSAISIFGNYIALASLDFSGAELFKDYTNTTYNPGILTATSSVSTGGTSLTLSGSPASSIINSSNVTSWFIIDLDKPTWFSNIASGASLLKLATISGNTVTFAAVGANYNITSGDRIMFQPSVSSGGYFIDPTSFNFAYVEDSLFAGAGIGMQVNGSFTWPNGPQWQLYIRKNVIYDSSSPATRNQGIFLDDTFNPSSTALVEENIVDHSGWRQVDPDCTPGQFLPSKCNGVASTQFYNFYGNPPAQSQNAYNHENCCNATYNRNILTNSQGSGTQIRSGGNLYNNLIYRNQTGATSGGIAHASVASYNTFGDLAYAYVSILTVRGVSGNTLTFDYVPQVLCSTGCGASQTSQPFNASNPSGISQTTNTSFTTNSLANTVTIGGPAISVSIGDTIYFVQTSPAAWGYDINSVSTNNNGTPINAGYPTDAEWNVLTNSILGNYRGGTPVGGFSLAADITASRTTGTKIANNFMMNQAGVGLFDESEIQSVDGNAACSGAVRIGLLGASSWVVGDTLVTSGIQPSSMNANGSFTVASLPDSTHACLSGSTFGAGSWTSGTGVINGGVAFGPNYYYNVGTPISVVPSTYTQTSPQLQAFTPVGTVGCPQALGCPSIEAYDLSIGGDGTLSHFIDGAKANRKGAFDTRYTAAAANFYIRSFTSATMPNPSF